LSNATLPYALALAHKGLAAAVANDEALGKGVNTLGGHVTYQAVADAFGMEHTPLQRLL
jgi:alanine dehydrogenase